ncbi:MAG: EAL domain-containing protein [Thermoanaerobaculia bacterium]
MSYLQCFDPDILKIDPTFVWGLEKDRGSAALVGGMIVLAQSLGIQVVG